MTAVGKTKLPFGNIPRLLLAWVSTEAVRTQSRMLVLGSSLSEFMRKLGLEDRSGSKRARPDAVAESNEAAFSLQRLADLRG